MATKGKAASSRSKAARPKTKGGPARKAAVRAAAPRSAAKPAARKSAGPSARKSAKPPARASVPVRTVHPGKPVASKAVPVASKIKPAVPQGKPAKTWGSSRPAIAAVPVKAAKGGAKPKPKFDRHAVVRPIGVLPPSAMARAMRPAPIPPPPPSKPRPRPQRETAPDEGAQGVSEKDFPEFEQRLLTERQKLLKEMGHIEANVLKINQRDSSGDLSGYSFHMADVGTDAMEREKAFMFASNEGQLLREVDDALRKIYNRTYGMCEICERPIARARLEAVPAARLCKSCKETEERSHRGMS